MTLSLTLSFADLLTALLQVDSLTTVGAPEQAASLGQPVAWPSCKPLLTPLVGSTQYLHPFHGG